MPTHTKPVNSPAVNLPVSEILSLSHSIPLSHRSFPTSQVWMAHQFQTIHWNYSKQQVTNYVSQPAPKFSGWVCYITAFHRVPTLDKWHTGSILSIWSQTVNEERKTFSRCLLQLVSRKAFSNTNVCINHHSRSKMQLTNADSPGTHWVSWHTRPTKNWRIL